MRTLAHLVPVALLAACTCEKLPEGPATRPPITAPFSDDFERAELGPDWFATAPESFRIENGAVIARVGHNHPLWLRRAIPRDATIEFDCWSESDDGDLKVEVWGDGRSFATDLYGQYTSTAYNFVFGGWRNQISTLARMHEHGADRQTRNVPRVEKGRHYHWTITRSGIHVTWLIDGQPFLAFDDAQPLEGAGHSFFAFTDWEAELHFDNLKITPR
jgi:hypothetical protein